jgi:transketolase
MPNFIAALKADDIEQLKTKFGFDPKKKYFVPEEVTAAYAAIAQRGVVYEQEWERSLGSYCEKYPNDHAELARRIKGDLPEGWEKTLPIYKPTDASVASRKLSETVLTALTPVLPDLMGGSADLTGSNLTKVPKSVDFQPESTGLGSYKGTYIRYGVREHAMGAIMNGLSAYGGIIPFGGTFLVSTSSTRIPLVLTILCRTLSATLPVQFACLPSAGIKSSGSLHTIRLGSVKMDQRTSPSKQPPISVPCQTCTSGDQPTETRPPPPISSL